MVYKKLNIGNILILLRALFPDGIKRPGFDRANFSVNLNFLMSLLIKKEMKEAQNKRSQIIKKCRSIYGYYR
jgi:hypothetical protein